MKPTHKTSRTIVVSIIFCILSSASPLMSCSDGVVPRKKVHGDLAEFDPTSAFNIYQELRQDESNIFYSPHSISMCLGMAYVGARNNTETEIGETMHFLPRDEQNVQTRLLDDELRSRNLKENEYEAKGMKLSIANAMWGQKGVSILREYENVLRDYYDSEIGLLDFDGEPEGSRRYINNWVDGKTQGRISELVPPGTFEADNALVLVNAIYFEASWRKKFRPVDTVEGDFKLLDGGTVTVPMMYQKEDFSCFIDDGYKAIELLYEPETSSMILILPDEGRFEEFESKLNYPLYQKITGSLRIYKVNLTMPKFEFRSDYKLRETLEAMGILDAFDPVEADFSGIVESDGIWIDEVYHQAYITVDEKGTIAAASSLAHYYKALFDEIEFTINRPFIFIIRDIPTNAILFMGRVLNPGEQ